eukprot:Awhi_evm1s11029
MTSLTIKDPPLFFANPTRSGNEILDSQRTKESDCKYLTISHEQKAKDIPVLEYHNFSDSILKDKVINVNDSGVANYHNIQQANKVGVLMDSEKKITGPGNASNYLSLTFQQESTDLERNHQDVIDSYNIVNNDEEYKAPNDFQFTAEIEQKVVSPHEYEIPTEIDQERSEPSVHHEYELPTDPQSIMNMNFLPRSIRSTRPQSMNMNVLPRSIKSTRHQSKIIQCQFIKNITFLLI